MKEEIKKIITSNKETALFIVSVMISSIFFLIGICIEQFNVALIGIMIIYLFGIYYSLRKLKIRMYYLTFFIVIYVFILSRPTISMFRGNEWWNLGVENEKWALISIYISIISLLIGGLIGDKIIKKYDKVENLDDKGKEKNGEIFSITDNPKIIQNISLVLFALSFVAKMMIQIDKYIFMIGKDYVDYYVLYQNTLPTIITSLDGMMLVFLIIYLITKPSKKMSILALSMYIVTNIPMLLIGERGSIIISIIFAFLYFWYRNSEDNDEKWIGKKEKILICILIPIGIIGLGVYNYTRSDEEIPSNNPIYMFTDFFYKQGVTFDVLNIGHGALNNLPDRENKNYTFGGIIDYIKYNSISCKLFNIEPIPEGNNIRKATESNSFAHAMSYTTRTDYLDGHGWGSSYLLETYADYGYIGIIVYSIGIGIFLATIKIVLDKQNIISIIVLYSLNYIYMAPRAEALRFCKLYSTISFLDSNNISIIN